MIKGSLQATAGAKMGELRGGALYRGILSEILFGKGTTNSGREQGNSEKNSENLQCGEDVRFSIILGNKKDNEGYRFFEKNGTIGLWRLDDLFIKAGREVTPIRLTDRNVRHALENHNNIFKSTEDVLEYVDYVLQNANVMRRTNNSSIYVSIEIEKNPDKTALLRLYLSDYGDYYNVETVGDRRKDFWKGKGYEIIARRSEPSKIDAVSNKRRHFHRTDIYFHEEAKQRKCLISRNFI